MRLILTLLIGYLIVGSAQAESFSGRVKVIDATNMRVGQ